MASDGSAIYHERVRGAGANPRLFGFLARIERTFQRLRVCRICNATNEPIDAAGSPSVVESRSGRRGRGGEFAKLRGVWRCHGYGNLLEIGATGYRLFEETRVSCLRVFEGTLDELSEAYVDVRRSPAGMAFSARRSTGVTRVRYRRMKALPRGCAAADADALRDPVQNFEVFWHTFAERYALFALREVDWEAVRAEHRPRVGRDTGPKRLFEVFVDMLRPLRDGHVELRAPHRHFNAGAPSSLQERLASELDGAGARQVDAFLSELLDRSWANVRERHLGGRTRRDRSGLLEWGRLDEATGYLAIRAMAGQSGRPDRPREDQEAAAAAMDRVMRDIGDLPAMVVDVRRNGGGYDGVALRIAGYLIDRKRLAFTKAPSKVEGYAGVQAIPIEPRADRRYAGRIFLLTSGLTASAAEIFVLALLQHPRLTRIGEPTHGELSDVMVRHLPNGWSVSLSNELYRASDGELYEDRGVPPHVEIPFLDPGTIRAGRDPVLDHVLEGGSEP